MAANPLAVPRVHVFDVWLKVGEPLHLTPLFDAHLDNALCDRDGLKRLASERRSLPNHRVFWGGDVLDLVLPPDQRRFRPSMQRPNAATVDDWLDEREREAIEFVSSLNLKHDIVAPGNHEDESLKRHGHDSTSVLAFGFGARRGGYSGVVDYRLHVSSDGEQTDKKVPQIIFRLAYHHGAWGGRLAKGYNSASAWFSQIEGWHVACFGHCHASRIDPEVRIEPDSATGLMRERPVYILNCGSWVYTYGDDSKTTHYGERAGYIRQPRTAPLITVTPRYMRMEKPSGRGSKLMLDYRITT